MPIKWQPFQEPKENPNTPDLFNQENWMPFMPATNNENPAVDIHQDKNNVYIEVSLVDVEPKDVEVSIDDNTLIIQTKKETKKETTEKDYLMREIKKGSFRRVIKLPVEVKGSKAMAESLKGILKITVPKVVKANLNAKKIPIKIK